MSCNSAIHATFPMALMMYKYSELQMFGPIQKLSHKANCKTTICLIVSSFKIQKIMCSCFQKNY